MKLTTAYVPADQMHEIAGKLRDDPEMSFDYLYCLTGVDLSDHMEVVYHLESTKLGHQIVVKVRTADRENPEVDTVCDLWPTAEFHEREAYDMFGIVFNNHPDLRRLLMTDDWVGYPLRKDYEDEVNMVLL